MVIQDCDLGGQPDSIALDTRSSRLVVAIENQRNEDLNKGVLPQLPAGTLITISLTKTGLSCGSAHSLDLTGLAAVAGEDPEPEFVKVNRQSQAVVTLQENNHLVLVDLKAAKVISHFSAGMVDLEGVDTKSDGVISLSQGLKAVPREPDAVAWIDDNRFVTANEGDYKGGSRGFTIFRKDGSIDYDSGNLLEVLAVQYGHYPEKRSRAKGAEPEGVEVGTYGKDRLIFIGAERASLVFVFKDQGEGKDPIFLQALPAGQGPEGLLAIPSRNLFVAASEVDKGARAGLMIYLRNGKESTYPSLLSGHDPFGKPIPWGAISGAARDLSRSGLIWAVTDNAYSQTRILSIDTQRSPFRIVGQISVTKGGEPQSLDAEGIVQRADGGFWLVSEGDPERKPTPTANQLIRLSALGEIEEILELPTSVSANATRFGFEGVTVTGRDGNEKVFIAVQRPWKDDPPNHVKILVYTPAEKSWGTLHYPLNQTNQKGAWIGLSEISALSDTEFIVIERDNLFGDNAHKSLYRFSVEGVVPARLGSKAPVPVLIKKLERNLVPDLQATNGNVLDKVESFVQLLDGSRFVITDNDGVDGSNGETMMIRLR